MTLAAVMAIAMTATIATNANATVEVGNPGNLTIDADFQINQIQGQADFMCTDSTFEATAYGNGQFDLDEIELDSYPAVPQAVDCDKFDDCYQAGAGGQIYGPGDATYDAIPPFAIYDYIVKFEDWCLDYDWYSEWGIQDIYWGIIGEGENQVWDFHTPQQAWNPGLMIDGPAGHPSDPSLTLSTPLEITNTEE